MQNANWLLLSLAFGLGLVLTVVLKIGRVTLEVPVDESAPTSDELAAENGDPLTGG